MIHVLFELKEQLLLQLFPNKDSVLVPLETERGLMPSKSFLLINLQNDQNGLKEEEAKILSKQSHKVSNLIGIQSHPQDSNRLSSKDDKNISVVKKGNYLVANKEEIMHKKQSDVKNRNTLNQDPNKKSSLRQIANDQSHHEAESAKDFELDRYLQAKNKSKLNLGLDQNSKQQGSTKSHFQDNSKVVIDNQHRFGNENMTDQLSIQRHVYPIKERQFYHNLCKREDDPENVTRIQLMSKSLKRSSSTPKLQLTYYDKYPDFYVKQHRKIEDMSVRSNAKISRADSIDKAKLELTTDHSQIHEKEMSTCSHCHKNDKRYKQK